MACLVISTKTHSETINDAITAINMVKTMGNPFNSPQNGGVCSTVMTSGYKAYCKMAAPNQAFLMIGCLDSDDCTGEDGQLTYEHSIMADLNKAGVPSAKVSPGLIDDMSCQLNSNDRTCSSFVEEFLPGTEIDITPLVFTALYNAGMDMSDCADDKDEVLKVMTTIFQESTEFQPVRNLTAAQAIEFSNSFQSMSDFADNEYGINDLQGFLQNHPAGNGQFKIFDPGSALKDDDRLCFINYTAAIAKLAKSASS